MQQNNGVLRGKLSRGGWSFSYERDGESFYSATVEVERLSGVCDEVPIIASSAVVDRDLDWSSCLTLVGSFRSRNKLVNGKSSLQLYFFADSVGYDETEQTNLLHIEGYICKKPIYRLTPFDREITDLLVAVNRNTKKSDYIPCIAWGRNASWAQDLEVGDRISIDGRIQSRKFTKSGDKEANTRVAYEVSISRISSI